MKKISLLLIASFLVLTSSGSYAYFTYIYEEDESSIEELIVQEEIIEEETTAPSNNQTNNNSTEDQNEEESLPYEIIGIYKCIDHNSEQRCWQTHEPDNLDSNQSVPLIVDMHGYSSNSTEQREMSDFDEIADQYGAIVIYPDGLGDEQSWNAGWCCGESNAENRDDVGFLLNMIDIVIKYDNIDTTRIYATGWSNGCAMSQRLANEASDIFAAIGCMSFYLLQPPDSSYSPIPVMEIHGFLDTIVPYTTAAPNSILEGEFFSNPLASSGALQNLYAWKEMNGCSGTLSDTNEPNALYSIQGFSDCENGTEVQLVTIYAAMHNPYSDDYPGSPFFPGTQGLVDSTQIAWDFMSQYTK